MEFNPFTCQVIHITRSKNPIPTQYTHNCILEYVYSAKYLGVDISSDLLWDTHINRISKMSNNTLGFLRRNIKIHSEVLVRPQLEYCSTVLCPFTDSNISKFEAVHRRAVRWVKHDYGQISSVTQMIQSLHWRRLDQRRIDNKLSLMYKLTDNGSFRLIVCKHNTSVNILFIINNIITYAL